MVNEQIARPIVTRWEPSLIYRIRYIRAPRLAKLSLPFLSKLLQHCRASVEMKRLLIYNCELSIELMRYLDKNCILDAEPQLRQLFSVGDPSMHENLGETDPMLRIDVQHSSDEIFC